jgi:hypothetical protein
MEQSREIQRAVRSLEARIAEQVEQVAQAICQDRSAEQEVSLLYKLSSLFASLTVRDKVGSSGRPVAQGGASPDRLALSYADYEVLCGQGERDHPYSHSDTDGQRHSHF